MENKIASLNSLWSNIIIEELIRQGCYYFCISPGSRSTPLTLAVANNPRAKSNIFFDERGAAYHALGYARSTNKPAILICTSGTAVANYLPAIIEAAQDGIPIIILTADRPPELRDTGANQTIDQVKLFGNYVRWYFELPTPDEDITPEFVLTTIDQVFSKSIHNPKRPVHINCMFREPFFSKNREGIFNNTLDKWHNSKKPFTIYHDPIKKYSIAKSLVNKINACSNGLIIAGKMDSKEDSKNVIKLAKKLQWPIFADITSNLRMSYTSQLIINHFDLLLLSDNIVNRLKPQMIIQFGKRIISKRLLNFLKNCKSEDNILVDNSIQRFDPMHIVTHRINSNISEFCKTIKPQINPQKSNTIAGLLKNFDSKIENYFEIEFSKNVTLSEPVIAYIISKFIPKKSGLFLANSMPVRDMDMFGSKTEKNIQIASNRGASGIDGTIASAIGFAEGLKSSCTLIIGDLAFIHDLNSLHQLDSSKHPLIIILINNRGGGIFSFLPIAQNENVFEKFFGTPHNFKFSAAAKLFNLSYSTPKTNREFIDNYKNALTNKKSSVIEVEIDRSENYKTHKNINDKIVRLLEN